MKTFFSSLFLSTGLQSFINLRASTFPLLLCMISNSSASETTWTGGGGTSNWVTPGNWSSGTPSNSSPPIIDLSPGPDINTVISNAFQPYYFFVGKSAGSNGLLTLSTGGSLTFSECNIGTENGSNGTVNIDGGTLLSDTDNTRKYIGRYAGSNGVVNISNGGSFTINAGETFVGNDGSGTVNINGGTLSSASNFYIGQNNGSNGNITISNGGELAVEYTLRIGQNSGSSGTVTVSSGGTVTGNNFTYVGANAGSNGTLNINGGSVTRYAMDIGYGGSGTVNINGGSLSASSPISVGLSSGSNGTVTISNGGTISSDSNSMYLASQSGSVGTLNIGAPAGDPAAAPGIALGMTSVQLGYGIATLNFNHTDSN